MRRGEIRRLECEDFAPRNGGTRASGEGGSKERRPPDMRKVKIRRLECEDFAPRNGDTRVCGEQREEVAGRLRGQKPAAGM